MFTDEKNNTLGAGYLAAAGSVLNGSGTLKVVGTTSSNTAYPNGMNNGIHVDGTGETDATINMTGNIVVENVGNQGIYVCGAKAAVTAGNITISNVGGNGIYMNDAAGKLNVTDTLTINGGNNHGLSSAGTVTAGNITIDGVKAKNGLEVKGGTVTVTGAITVTNLPKGHGINNVGTVTAGSINISGLTGNNGIENVGGTVKATTITISNMTKYGIHSKGGTVEATTMSLSDMASIGIFGETECTIKAANISVVNVKNQAIQVNHKNTLEIGTLYVKDCSQNALRMYNKAGQPTVTITEVIADTCAGYAVAADQQNITSDNLSIGTVWFVDCGKGALHAKIQSGVGAVKNELPATEPQQTETPAPVVPAPETEETTPATEETVPATQETTPVTQETTPATESTETTPAAEAEASAAQGAAEAQTQPTTTEQEEE